MSETTAILNPPEISTTAKPRAALVARLKTALGDAVVRKGALSVFDQAVVSGTSFVTSVAVGRLCGRADLGVYYLALSVVLLIRGIQEQIISAPFSVFCHRRKDSELATYFGSALLHQAVVLMAAVIGFTAFAWLVNAGCVADAASVGTEAGSFRHVAWMLIGVAPLLLLRESLRHFAFARLAVRTALAIDVTVAFLQIAGLGALAFFGELTVGRVYAVMGTACGFACIVAFRSATVAEAASFRVPGRSCQLLPRLIRFDRSRFLPDWKQNWSFSKWALASHLVGCSTPYVLPWFVAAVDGTAATGLLAACTTLVGLGNAFMMGLANYLTPKAAQSFAAGGAAELRAVLKKTALLFAVTLGGFALFACVAGNWAAVLIYGNDYAGAGPILAVLAFGLFANSIGVTAGNGLWAMHKPAANFRADVCALFVTIIAAVLLTPRFGVLGAATSSLIGATIDAVIRTWTLLRLMRVAETRSSPKTPSRG
jgi:O-antigen/teichoic acid export membrane protein